MPYDKDINRKNDMRLICIGDTPKNTDGHPCKTLASAIQQGNISLRIAGKEGILGTLHDFPADIIVIQQEKPDIALVKLIRNNRFNTPILIITRTLTALSISNVLMAGADDCVSLVMEPVELLARLKAIVRRYYGTHINSQTTLIGRLKIREDTREVLLDDNSLMLTHGEYEIMSLMVKRRGSLLNKKVILNALYDESNRPVSKTIDVMICRIRQKMRKRGILEPFKTSWGMGYRLNEEAFLPFGARNEDDFETMRHFSKEASLPVSQGLNISSSSS